MLWSTPTPRVRPWRPAPASAGADVCAVRALRRVARSALRDALVRQFMPLAHHLARRYRGHGENDDLVQVASMGLLKAIERFDPSSARRSRPSRCRPSSGSCAATSATTGGRSASPGRSRSSRHASSTFERTSVQFRAVTDTRRVGRGLRRAVEQVSKRWDTATAIAPLSLDTPAFPTRPTRPSAISAASMTPASPCREQRVGRRLLAPLSEREQTILRLRFQEDLTQAEIGARVGVSQMHVSRVVRQAIAQPAGRRRIRWAMTPAPTGRSPRRAS